MLNFVFEICVKGENFCFGANKTVYQTLWEGILKGKRIFPIINLEIHCVSLCPMCHAWWNSDIQGPLTVTCAEISMDINVWPWQWLMLHNLPDFIIFLKLYFREEEAFGETSYPLEQNRKNIKIMLQYILALMQFPLKLTVKTRFDFTGNRTEPFQMLCCNINLLSLKYFHTAEQRSLKRHQKDCFLLGCYNVLFLFK